MTKVKFHQDHAWIRMEGGIGIIGISQYAQEQMGKIIYVELPEPGTEVIAGEPLGALESSKVTSDLMAPVSGEVVESNQALEEEPTLVNDSPYERGWITRVRLKDPAEIDGLMEEAAYLAQVSNIIIFKDEHPHRHYRRRAGGLSGRHPGRPVGGGGLPF